MNKLRFKIDISPKDKILDILNKNKLKSWNQK